MCQNFSKNKEKIIRVFLFLFLIVFFACGTLLGCASKSPSTTLSKTREITVPELDGKVLVSAIQYAGKTVFLSSRDSISIKDDTKRIAIFSIQIQNAKKNKSYELAPIVLLDGDKKIFPDAVKYFRGNSGFILLDWDIKSREVFFHSLKMKGSRGGKYTVDLLYAIDIDKEITKAEIYGQLIEFDTEKVKLNVIDKFN
jgi:hypothetical protein